MPNDLPPWYSVYQQAQRWIAAGVFEDMVHDLRALVRLAKAKKNNLQQQFSTVVRFNPLQKVEKEQATMDINAKKGSKIHIAVDTLGLLLAAHVTPVNVQERAQVKELANAV